MGRYVGKAKMGAGRPLKDYPRNVAKIRADRPYRISNPTGFRRIHLALAEAERTGLQITLQFLCNVAPHENINEVERMHIRQQRCLGAETWQLNGARVNNSVDA